MTSAFERELRAARWPQSLPDLVAAGVTADMTRSRRWRRSTRGFFVPADTPSTTTQRILDVSPLVPPGGAVAGWAAAYALGVGLLDGQDPFTMAVLPVPIHLGRDLGRLSPPGVRFARERLPAAHHQVVHGLPVTTPLRTMFDGGRWADSLTEAVVFWTRSRTLSRSTSTNCSLGVFLARGGLASSSCAQPSRWPTRGPRALGSHGCGCSTCSRPICLDLW
jgi:hypothetical protein